MRIKKDPEIRKEKFMQTASKLFMQKGYDAVSIREILDGVGDKTSSPSVFYYYFTSKENLYRSCMQHIAATYLASLAPGFSENEKGLSEQYDFLVRQLKNNLEKNRRLLQTGSSTANRLSILDMREQVTSASVRMWADYLIRTKHYSIGEACMKAQFLSGGIGEMIYQYMIEKNHGQKTPAFVIAWIIHFILANIRFSAEEKAALQEVGKKYGKEKA